MTSVLSNGTEVETKTLTVKTTKINKITRKEEELVAVDTFYNVNNLFKIIF